MCGEGIGDACAGRNPSDAQTVGYVFAKRGEEIALVVGILANWHTSSSDLRK
jgi:hypothetical protein